MRDVKLQPLYTDRWLRSIRLLRFADWYTGMIDDPNDPSYEPTDSQTSTLLTTQSSQSVMSAVDDRKFVVFECQLDKLLRLLVCPTCQGLCCMDDIDKKCSEGTLLRVTAYCIKGHVIVKWQSQPLIGRMPAGNLLIGAATLFTGQTYGHMQNIAELLNLKFMSHTPFYTMQHTNFSLLSWLHGRNISSLSWRASQSE